MTANLRISAIERPIPHTQLQEALSVDPETAADAVAAEAKHDPGAALALLHRIVARSVLEGAGGGAGALMAASVGLAGWSHPLGGDDEAPADQTLSGLVSNGRLKIEGRQAFHEIDVREKPVALVVVDRDITRGGYLVVLDATSHLRQDEPIFERAGFRERWVEIKTPLKVDTYFAIAPDELKQLIDRALLLEELLHASFDLGLLRGFAEAAHEYITTRTRPWQGQSLAKATDDPHLVRRYGEYLAIMQALEGLIEEATAAATVVAKSDADASGRQNAIKAVAAARAYAILAGRSIISGTIELLGAGATSQRYGFDLFWRDFTAHAVAHPPLWPFEIIGRDFVRTAGRE